MAGVLVASAIAKWRNPDDLAGWAELGVPRAFRKAWMVRLHPWGEAALAVLLVVGGGVLGLAAALACGVLMATYLWLVARSYSQTSDASCACFGTRRRITAVTITRNAWLTLVAVATASVIWMNPLVGGALVAGSGVWPWLVGALIAVITTALVLWPESRSADPGAPGMLPASTPVPAASEDDLDYVRTRIPAVPVTAADGTTLDLRLLASRKALLLLAVSEHCGACLPTIESVARYRELLPEVDVRFLIHALPEHSELTTTDEPQSLHDPYGYVSRSISDWPTPTAVLLGADGMLAGGPQTGSDAIDSFVDDIYESLHGVRPASASAER